MSLSVRILSTILTLSTQLTAAQRTKVIDFESHLTAAIESCEELKTGDVCSVELHDGTQKGTCVWDTDLKGQFINACIPNREQ